MAHSANLSAILSGVYDSEEDDNILWIQSFKTEKTLSLYALPIGVLSLMRHTWRVFRLGQLKTDTPDDWVNLPSNISSVLCFENNSN